MPADGSAPLARITPVTMIRHSPLPPVPPRGPSPREKAAIIVRLLLAEGRHLPLSSLPEHMQAALAEQMGQMRLVDRGTMQAVVDEFLSLVEDAGIAFPNGIEGALGLMDGHISATAASRLRRLAGASAKADPWDRLTALPADRLLPVIEAESTEVAAVMLSKLPVPKAAELLSRLPGDRARRIAYAISMTAGVDPETVRRIGLSLAAELDAQPARAFEAGPVERVGAILNVSPAATREDVLTGLDATDAGFAEQVRRAIFTFAHVPRRIAARDLPKVLRIVEPAQIITAFGGASTPADRAAVEFFLAHISPRMAQTIREEIATRGKVKEPEAEAAQAAIVAAIRQLEGAGEISLQNDAE